MRSNLLYRTAIAIVVSLALALFAIAAVSPNNDLVSARDRGDRAALDALIKQSAVAAGSNKSADATYRLALAYSYAAEVAMEQKDKSQSEKMAEAGLDVAKKAVASNDKNAEYHRLLGALCGQVIPANPIMGTLQYGPCARDEITRALQLDAANPLAYVSRGVGNYYLPASMGGGPDMAIKDFDKAISLDPKLSDAFLWKGITLRKEHRNQDARAALQQAVKLSPNRLWAKEQLEKTPAQ